MRPPRVLVCAIALGGLGALAPARSHAEPVPQALRVTAELHAGVLSVVAGAGLGLLVAGTGTDELCWSRCKSAWAMVGGVVGLVAAPFATLAVAESLGAQADLGPTLLGFAMGMQVDALLSVLIHKLVGTDPGDVPTIAWVLAATVAFASPLVGAAVGAEW